MGLRSSRSRCDTVKYVGAGGVIERTVDRRPLWFAQTRKRSVENGWRRSSERAVGRRAGDG